jgi:GrpB-like predicted nucleotidyltransferase (UPF0157 family)
MDVNEPIILSEYDFEWPTRFANEKRAILNLGEVGFTAVEHFGSTAVPGMVAKPIIDILIRVESLPPTGMQVRALETLAYESLGEAGVPGRFYFRRRGDQAFNIGVVEWNGPIWRDGLLLRDFLRSNAEYARQYGTLKRAALDAGHTDLLDYSANKHAFMRELLRQAEQKVTQRQ